MFLIVIAMTGLLQSCATTRYRVTMGNVITYVQWSPEPESDEVIVIKEATVARRDSVQIPWYEVLKGQSIEHQVRIDSLTAIKLANTTTALAQRR